MQTADPDALDRILRKFGAFVCQTDAHKGTYLKQDDGYVVRCFGNLDAVEAIIQNQHCGKLIKKLPEL